MPIKTNRYMRNRKVSNSATVTDKAHGCRSIALAAWAVAGMVTALVSCTPRAAESSTAAVTENGATQTVGSGDGQGMDSVRQAGKPGGTFSFGAGPVWTTSKLYVANDHDYMTNVRGTGFGISLSNLPGGWYGYSIDLYGSHTKVENIAKYTLIKDFSYTQVYLGPSFVCAGRLAGPLRGSASVGLGMAVYNGIDDTQFGFGLRSTLGLEVMVSGKVGIGIEGVSQRHFFKKPDNFNLPDDEFYGFQQLGILFGLRIYH